MVLLPADLMSLVPEFVFDKLFCPSVETDQNYWRS